MRASKSKGHVIQLSVNFAYCNETGINRFIGVMLRTVIPMLP